MRGTIPEGPARTRRRPTSRVRYYAAIAAVVITGVGVAIGATVSDASAAPAAAAAASSVTSVAFAPTHTPIKHVVVLFDENVSFDHYFGTYPFAANTDGSVFHAKPGTPTVNGLYTKITASGPVGPLLTSNPTLHNPTRLTHAQALTCDQNHDYTPEQQARAASTAGAACSTSASGHTSDPLFSTRPPGRS